MWSACKINQHLNLLSKVLKADSPLEFPGILEPDPSHHRSSMAFHTGQASAAAPSSDVPAQAVF